MEDTQRILVLGATGYVGGRLVPLLLKQGYHVRASSRSIRKLQARSWSEDPNCELAAADVLNAEQVQEAMTACDVVYYLVHSMNPASKDFAETDRRAAETVLRAAEAAGVKRIIYLGGLGEDSPTLSKHLQSRAEVAKILQSGSIPITYLRAALILGSGSASFEILRYLVEHLPVMITPRWVDVPCQPIAIRNVLNYLAGCLQAEETTGQTLDIGGPDILTYRKLMGIYTKAAGLGKRWILPVPVFSLRLSSYWIHLITPVPSYIARPLAEGLKNPVVCRDNRIREWIPQTLLSCEEAIELALERLQHENVETHWLDAGRMPPVEWRYPGDPGWAGGTVFEDQRLLIVEGTPEDLWGPISRIGGKTGWYYGTWLWKLRGLLDQLVGGQGLRSGRKHSDRLMPGDFVDFWRVIDVQRHQRLLLKAEMRMPGEAYLEFVLTPVEGGTQIVQTAHYMPGGLFGILYWMAVTPFHYFVFNGMLAGLAARHPVIEGPRKVKKPSAKPAHA